LSPVEWIMAWHFTHKHTISHRDSVSKALQFDTLHRLRL